jgi:hypothetical protein
LNEIKDLGACVEMVRLRLFIKCSVCLFIQIYALFGEKEGQIDHLSDASKKETHRNDVKPYRGWPAKVVGLWLTQQGEMYEELVAPEFVKANVSGSELDSLSVDRVVTLTGKGKVFAGMVLDTIAKLKSGKDTTILQIGGGGLTPGGASVIGTLPGQLKVLSVTVGSAKLTSGSQWDLFWKSGSQWDLFWKSVIDRHTQQHDLAVSFNRTQFNHATTMKKFAELVRKPKLYKKQLESALQPADNCEKKVEENERAHKDPKHSAAFIIFAPQSSCQQGLDLVESVVGFGLPIVLLSARRCQPKELDEPNNLSPQVHIEHSWQYVCFRTLRDRVSHTQQVLLVKLNSTQSVPMADAAFDFAVHLLTSVPLFCFLWADEAPTKSKAWVSNALTLFSHNSRLGSLVCANRQPMGAPQLVRVTEGYLKYYAGKMTASDLRISDDCCAQTHCGASDFTTWEHAESVADYEKSPKFAYHPMLLRSPQWVAREAYRQVGGLRRRGEPSVEKGELDAAMQLQLKMWAGGFASGAYECAPICMQGRTPCDSWRESRSFAATRETR